MVLPSFTDLGKNAREVFKTGYHYGKGLFKLNIKTKTAGNFLMTSDLSLDFEASKLNGLLEAKYKTKDYGVFLEKWTTDGTLYVGYDLDNIIKNIGLCSEVNYNPGTADKGIKFGAKCINDVLNAACSISSDLNSNVNILGSLVTGYKDLLIGYQGGYDSSTNSMTKNDVGLAFSYVDFGLHFRCTSIPNEYGLSLLYKATRTPFLISSSGKELKESMTSGHVASTLNVLPGFCIKIKHDNYSCPCCKVNDDWDTAINGILARSDNRQEWTVGVGARCKIDEKSTFRLKFNTDYQLGTSLQQKIDESITLTLSFNIDCANVTKGGHKVGLALDVEA